MPVPCVNPINNYLGRNFHERIEEKKPLELGPVPVLY